MNGIKEAMIQILAIIIFLSGYIVISQEHFLLISKTSVSLIIGVVLWLLVLISGNDVGAALSESGSEIFELIIFLLSAMTLVEILTHFGLFDIIYNKLISYKLKDKCQFFIISFLTFIFSAILDNLTSTIVFLQIASRFFRSKNLVRAAAAIIIAANAGGAFSPIGDVTTTMLWLSNKFSTQTIITQAFLPSLMVFLVSTLLIGRSISVDTKDIKEKSIILSKTDWIIIALCLLSFLLPIVMTLVRLPPYFGLLLGLGIIWLVMDLAKIRAPHNTKLRISIEKLFQNTDIASLYFFIGILIAIAALSHLGVLDEISYRVFGEFPSVVRIISGNIIIGGLSAFFDNIPLTAAAIDIVRTTDPNLWVLLAITVGVGGSLLLIGSAPGIVAMSIVRNLTFSSYLSIANIPALIGYGTGIAVWLMQYYLIF